MSLIAETANEMPSADEQRSEKCHPLVRSCESTRAASERLRSMIMSWRAVFVQRGRSK